MSISAYIGDVIHRIKNGGNDVFEILLNDDSVSLQKNGKLLTCINWADIQSIAVGKLDRVTYDPIVIYLAHSPDGNNGTGFEEFMLGFSELIIELNSRYSLDSSWLNRVNDDAFKSNWKMLWKCN